MPPEEFLGLLAKERASAILRTSDEDLARGAMKAAVDAGFRIIEFTLSVPNAFGLIREFSERDELVVGAGTVLTTEEAERAVEAGAEYLVSPVVDPVIIKKAAELDVAAMPGCATPTEMLTAHRAGAQLQKLFPGVATGPVWVQQTLGPMPFLKIVPTSGVTVDNAAAYLKAGAFAVGFVNSLFEPEDVLGGHFQAIGERARKALAAVNRSG